MTTSTAIKIITSKLDELFVDMDARVLKSSIEWGLGRKIALKALIEELSPKRREMGEWAYYERLFGVCGGKTWFKVFAYENDAGVEQFITKNCERIAKNRNASIAAKLLKAEVTEVVSSEYQRTNDGFDGCFVVETNRGRKIVTINTVYAGGYNIQCLHLRVLVKVR